MRVSLSGSNWTVEAIAPQPAAREAGRPAPPTGLIGRRFPAVVPGCVHTDLIRAGVIEHPDARLAELEQLWVGETDWRYRTEFVATNEMLAAQRVDLVCDQLDTIASIQLNGRQVGEAADQHVAHRYDLRPALVAGSNELVIEFASPLRFVRAESSRLGPRPVNGDWEPYNVVRKAACSFGWDWGPRVPTVGIARDIAIELWSVARIASVRPLVWREFDGNWRVDVHVQIERTAAAPQNSASDASDAARSPLVLEVELRHPQTNAPIASATTPCAAAQATLALHVRDPRRWMPRGCGEQPLYPLRVRLAAGAGACELDACTARIGFRTLRLNTLPDEHGAAFTLEVNGVPIFAKGANWIPEGLFPRDRAPERLIQRLRQAADANLNLIRVWGGGTCESPAFYDACDELGLLVWQDFPFACALYPEEEPLCSLVRNEAEQAVARLSRHASLVLWCGGNECIWAHESWGFGQRLKPGQTWGQRYWLDLLPEIVARVDPTRPYWPNSPYSGSLAVHPLDPDRGNRHTWDAWGDGCRGNPAPRFVSEFGHQSPPNLATLAEAVGCENLTIGSPALVHRQRATGGDAVHLETPRRATFRPPHDFTEWHYQAQLLAARSLAAGIEWLRANRPRCMGAVFWQLNDAWTGPSWSVVDAAGRRKLGWYAVRRACAGRRLTIQPRADGMTLVAINDEPTAWPVACRVQRMHTGGACLASAQIEGVGGPCCATHIADLRRAVGDLGDPKSEFLVVDGFAEGDPADPAQRCTWFAAPDRELGLPEALLQLRWTATASGGRARVTAGTVLRDLCLVIDPACPDAEVSEQLVTLLPGEAFDFVVTGEGGLPAELIAGGLRTSTGPAGVTLVP